MKKSILTLLIATATAGFCAQAATMPLSGEGTQASPYLVTSTTDWNDLAAYISENTDSLTGQYVQLTADLDFSSTSITPLTIFNGDFDGNSKTIKGISYTTTATYQGALMAYVYGDAYIHDVTVEGDVTTAKQYTGGLFGKLYGKLYNVTGRVNVTATANYAAGISAYNDSGASMVNVVNEGNITSSNAGVAGISYYSASGVEKYENCVNRGTITYTGTTSSTAIYVSGLLCSGSNLTMTNCHNEGTVTCPNGGGYPCGLVGYIGGTTASPYAYITDCYNTGDITGYAATGIFTSGSNYTCVTMTGCYNTGTITGTGTSAKSGMCTGGIGGGTLGSGSTFTGCWNSGTITSVGTSYTGGLFGYYKSSSSYYTASLVTTVANCYNTGIVSASGLYAGGIFGYQYKYVTADSCYNTGDVSGKYFVGGISGFMYGPGSYISDSYNTGDITTTSSHAGGIIGYTATSTSISRSFNTGDVTSTGSGVGYNASYAWAIGGIAGYCSAAITDCYNTGDVTGTTSVGGIMGTAPAISSSSVKPALTNVYSTGKITASEGYGGNIVGTGTAEGTYWSSDCTIAGAYYLTENNFDNSDTLSTGLTRAQLAALSMGDNWTSGDNYTYPRVTTIADNDYAKAHAAAVIPAVDTDTYAAMTGVFYLGAPDNVTWAADNSVISYSGQMGYFNADYAGGTITMTATSGDVAVTTELVYGVTTGVESVLSDDDLAEAEIVSETLYNTSGQIVTAPADGQKAIYIVRRVYSDGTVTTAKEAR